MSRTGTSGAECQTPRKKTGQLDHSCLLDDPYPGEVAEKREQLLLGHPAKRTATLCSVAPHRRARPRRPLQRSAVVLLSAALLLYPIDWLLWQLRRMTGDGMSTVQVTEITAATLKGNRFEVYSEQLTLAVCSRSLLPQAGARPCWWLRRHPQVVNQY